ncbi:hypothetical protein J6590_054784 [Homalodisca vitripennis]|nr:hypothetical protein J6590_054784 [Homalodisca vitripennis]
MMSVTMAAKCQPDPCFVTVYCDRARPHTTRLPGYHGFLCGAFSGISIWTIDSFVKVSRRLFRLFSSCPNQDGALSRDRWHIDPVTTQQAPQPYYVTPRGQRVFEHCLARYHSHPDGSVTRSNNGSAVLVANHRPFHEISSAPRYWSELPLPAAKPFPTHPSSAVTS